jgi:hypothetical protein
VPTGGRATGGVATGGVPTGGVPTGGVPTGGRATGGVATGGVPTGGRATGGVATGGRATGGTPTGGRATGGTAPTEPCTPDSTQAGGQCTAFDTTGTYCLRTADTLAGWGCSNWDGRTVAVNGTTLDCGDPLPAPFNGYYYFDVSAGTYAWACIYWWP